MASVELRAYARGIARAIMGEGSDKSVFVSSGGELITCQGLPPETELSRQGAGFYTIGTAVTAVAAIPTTAAHLSLYNGNTQKSLIIAAVGTFAATTAVAATNITLLARTDVPYFNVNPAGALIIAGLDGRMYSGSANAKASVTLGAIGAGNNTAWMPVGPSLTTTSTTTVAIGTYADVQGRWVVRPGGLFSLATVAATAVGTYQPYIYFYEAYLPLP